MLCSCGGEMAVVASLNDTRLRMRKWQCKACQSTQTKLEVMPKPAPVSPAVAAAHIRKAVAPLREFYTPPPQLHRLAGAVVRDMLADLGVTLDEIRSPSRNTKIVSARRRVMRLLAARNWSSTRIAGFTNRCHTTVLYSLGRLSTRAPAPWKRREDRP